MVDVEVDAAPISIFTPSNVLLFVADPLVTFANSSENADGYYWNFGDGAVSTDENPWHSYSSTGDYSVSLIALNGDCPNDTSSVIIKVREANDMAEEVGFSLEIYPNPTDALLYVNIGKHASDSFQYGVYDAQGKCVIEGVYSNGISALLLDVSQLADGLYQLKLTIDHSLLVTKFVVGSH